jgi:hypothetical protein
MSDITKPIPVPPAGVQNRVDGFIGGGADPANIPEPIAKMIQRQMPLDDEDEVAIIKARMVAAHIAAFGAEDDDAD